MINKNKYKNIEKKGEGTFSEVYKVQHVEHGTFHAIKFMKEKYSSLKEVCMCVYYVFVLGLTTGVDDEYAWDLSFTNFPVIRHMILFQVNKIKEIQALRKLSPHPNIVNMHDVLFDPNTYTLGIVFELMDKNLYDLISGK